MKVAILAEQNFNLIDGSTIWLLNTCKMLSELKGMQVYLLSAHHVTNPILLNEVPASVRFCDPIELGLTRLGPENLEAALSHWDSAANGIDRVFVRGDAFLNCLLDMKKWSGRVVAYAPGVVPRLGTQEKSWLAKARGLRAPLVVQSEQAKGVLESLGDYPAACIHVVPPVVFPVQQDPHRRSGDRTTLCYSGKIDKEYGLDWIADVAQEIEGSKTKRVMMIAGKDTNRSKHPAFFARMDKLHQRADETDGAELIWRTHLPSSQAKLLMAESDFGFCLRSERYADVMEISTKVLEFCALGVPPILNDTELNRSFMGADYPYFLKAGADHVVSQVLMFLETRHEKPYADALHRLQQIVEKFSVSRAAITLGSAVGWRSACSVDAKRTILIATHDPKFLHLLTDRLAARQDVDVRWENWLTTEEHGGPRARTAACDTIFCEWCCGNAVWHSHNKRRDQKLIIRLHRFEAFRDFPRNVNWGNVDALLVVSDWFRSWAIQQLNVPEEKVVVVPQFIKSQELKRPKLPAARFTLGLVGINPFSHKRFDRALDFLADARAVDQRFNLVVRSVMPWDIPWVWNGKDETKTQFAEQFRRIQDDPRLAGHVRFDAAGSDMEEWFRSVGTILSTSENEGCHTAVMEGIASGCLPVVMDWPGADTLFAPYVFSDLSKAVPKVLERANSDGDFGVLPEFSQKVIDWDVANFEERLMAI